MKKSDQRVWNWKVGSKAGSLTLIKELERKQDVTYDSGKIFLAECDCGHIEKIHASCLSHHADKEVPACESCWREKSSPFQIGDVYDKLTIIGFEGTKNGFASSMAVCRCECGNVIGVVSSALPRNTTNNCGECMPFIHTGLRTNKGLPDGLYSSYRRNAEKRNFEFSVSKDYLWDLLVAQDFKCALSGLPITLARLRKNREGTTISLDRINSKLGYIPGNVQWVHKTVNRLKWDLPESELIEFCHHISVTAKAKEMAAA